MHVAVHALCRRNRTGEGVLNRVALFLLIMLAISLNLTMCRWSMMEALLDVALFALVVGFGAGALHPVFDRRIDRGGLAIAAILRIAEAVTRLTIIGVNDMTPGTA